MVMCCGKKAASIYHSYVFNSKMFNELNDLLIANDGRRN